MDLNNTQDYIVHLQPATISNHETSRYTNSNNNAAGFDFVKIGIIQPKLKISQPDDAYEQEADKVADQVMRMAGD